MGQKLATRPYSGIGDKTLPDNVKALPDHAREIWVAAFNSAWGDWTEDKTDLTKEGYAFAIAWAAVKKLYKQEDGTWVKRSVVQAGDGYLTKVWRAADGRHRWRANVMDDGVDEYATRMTIDFQKDVCGRAQGGEMPWLGIAHFGGQSRIGVADRFYQDGRVAKAEGVFFTDSEDPLQRELATRAYENAKAEAELLPAHRKIATSQAFYPEAFVLENCGVIGFTAGEVDHIALTTKAANSRSDFTAEEETDMARRSKTRRELRREDAAAIVGAPLAQKLYELDEEGERSVEEDGLLYRTTEDGGVEVSPDEGDTWEGIPTDQDRAMVPTHRPALNDAGDAWDATAARKGIFAHATVDGEFKAERARPGFAIFDSEHPDNKTALALPHHVVSDGKWITHQRGTIAAGGVTMGARGGIKEFQAGDNKRAQTHLAPHYGQMDRTPPWKREESNLRDWAEAMEEVEILASMGYRQEEDVTAARAALRARIEDGTIELPPLAELRATLEPEHLHPVAAALLRATGQDDLQEAIKAVVSDPDALERTGPAPAPAGAKPPQAQHRTLMPDADYSAELEDRYGAEPDDTVLGKMRMEQLTEAAYHAGWTFLDIIIANIAAEPDEVTLEERIGNVQRAIDEFSQIVNQLINNAAQPRSREGGPSKAPGSDVKPGGGGTGPVKPQGGGSQTGAQAEVVNTLGEIRAFLDAGGTDADQAQHLIDELARTMGQIVEEPPLDLAGSLAEAMAPVLERLDRLERSTADQLTAGGSGPGYGAPRRRGIQPRLGAEPQVQTRTVGRGHVTGGVTVAEFARGAHRRGGMDPYE